MRSKKAARTGKYEADGLVAMFRKAATFRNEMIAAGFTDNGGAIHSAERILNILGQRLNYPGLAHINNLRHFEKALFSIEARRLHRHGHKVLIEHVSPLRALTRRAIERMDRGVTDAQFKTFVRRNYKLVLLSPDEALRLNRRNRSQMSRDRLGESGIRLSAR